MKLGLVALVHNAPATLLWIWLPLTTTAHHPWTTSPIIHCTHTFPSTITPITQLSPITHLPWLPHHTCTSFTHSLISSTHTLTLCEVLFSPWLTFLSVLPIHPAVSVVHPGLPDLGSLNLCLWPRLLPGIVYVSALPLIFLFLPADLACLILPIKYCCKWIHSPLTIPHTPVLHYGYIIRYWLCSQRCICLYLSLQISMSDNVLSELWPSCASAWTPPPPPSQHCIAYCMCHNLFYLLSQ